MAAPPPAPPGPCVLALDVGSSSVRAGLYDAAGRPVGGDPAMRIPYRWRTPPGGGMEVDAEEVVGLAVRVLDAALEEARRVGAEVAAVASTTLWHSLMGVDGAGEPLTPLYGWGEARPARAALALRARLDARAVHQRTGCFLHPSYPAARLLWLREEMGDTFPRVRGWVSIGEHLERRLFGVRRCSLSMGSGTGLMELERCRWDAEVLEAVGAVPGTLSPLVDTDAPAPKLLPGWARRWPELAEVPWIPPLGDGACANVGSGAVGKGRVAVTVGTSAAMRVLWSAERVSVPDPLWCYRLDGRRLVMGRALSNGGNGVAYLGELLRLPPPPEAEAALREMEPDAHGLTVVPSLLAERAPGWELWSGAALLGVTSGTRPVEVLRAWLEAVAYRLAGVHEALEAALGEEGRVVAGGGALHASSVWAGILADVLGRRITLTAEPEASSRGAALVALERLGLLGELCAAPHPGGTVIEPDPLRHARYRAARRRQEEVERLLASRAEGRGGE